MEDLARALLAGDAAALARSISLVEEGTPRGEAILAEVYGRTGRAPVIGITGPPGVGKSSLVNRLVSVYRARTERVGVVAVDPSSAFTGGAILGDRIRMQEHTLDPDVFIRSMATRGRFGGLSRATRDAVDLMDAAGRSPILIETVGVGQDEVDIVRVADTVLVVLTPGQGDDIQAIKAGLLEIADLFVINKADHAGADRLASDLEGLLALGERSDWTPAIVMTVATESRGVDDLVAAIDRHAAFLRAGDGLEKRRRAATATRLLEILHHRLTTGVLASRIGEATLEGYETRLMRRQIDPYTAAREMLERLGSQTGAAPGDERTAVLDHLGIAVRTIEERVALYRDVLGLPLLGVEEVAGEGVRVALLPAGGTRIELLEPTGKGTPVARFLETRGEGIHHLCFEVRDLGEAVERFRKAGLEIAGAAGRRGAEGSRIAFIHPRGTGGVLIELRERCRTESESMP